MSKSKITPPDVILSKGQSKKLPVVDHYTGNSKFLNKALLLFGANSLVDITIDLEDGAAIGNENERAQELSEILGARSQRHAGVRIHSLDSDFWVSDLKIFFARCAEKISHITIPKVEDPHLVKAAISYIDELRKQHGVYGKNPTFGVHLMIETPTAVSGIEKFASLEGVRGLDLGIMDFVSCFEGSVPLEAMSSPIQFSHPIVTAAKTAIVINAHTYGLAAAHNVTVQLEPMSSAREDARKAKQMGFTRMWSIHPNQVPEILAGFSPSAEEINLAVEVLTKAQAANWGPVEVDGVLYDRASYRWLWETASSNL